MLDPGETETHHRYNLDAASSQGVGDNQGYIVLKVTMAMTRICQMFARVLAPAQS